MFVQVLFIRMIYEVHVNKGKIQKKKKIEEKEEEKNP